MERPEIVDAWMEAQKEMMESWMEAQKEFIESWVKAQREFMDSWVEAAQKMDPSFVMGISRNGGLWEMLNLYRAWLTTMADSTQAFEDEAGKLQETWKKTVEKQMDMSTEMATSFLNFFKKGADKQ